MTDRTSPNDKSRHALRVLDGGLSPAQQQLDDAAARQDRLRLAEEIAEASRLADRLEADGLRVAFDLDGTGHGVRVSVRDDQGHDHGRITAGDATNPSRLAELSGTAS